MRYSFIIKIFFGYLLVITIASCNKKLDIEPVTSVDETNALKSNGDVQAALVGAYSDLGTTNLYGGRAFVLSELLANVNELNWTGTFQGLTQIFRKQIPIDNTFATNTWLTAYSVINDVNMVLASMNLVLPTAKSKTEAEAKFIRACVYFELVRLYAKSWNDGSPAANDGVPILLTPTKIPLTDADKRPRAKVVAVYQQIINDLSEAETALPAKNGFFATKSTAAAMLSRVYLQQGEYAKARDAANRVISASLYKLTNSYAEAFPYNNNLPRLNTTEDILSIQVTKSSGTNDFQNFFSGNTGRGEIDIMDPHLDLYEAGDDRLNLFYTSQGSVYTGKFDNLYGNVGIIRLAEMYLTRAESNFRLGTSVGASPVDDINIIRERVGLPAYTAAALTIDNILQERTVEFAFEGLKLQDIKRTKGSVGSLPWNSPKLVLPIPDRERKVNTNLTQNDGY